MDVEVWGCKEVMAAEGAAWEEEEEEEGWARWVARAPVWEEEEARCRIVNGRSSGAVRARMKMRGELRPREKIVCK